MELNEKKFDFKVQIGMFEIEIPETVNCIKKYNFVEVAQNHWKKGFTEVKKLGRLFAIKHDVSDSWSVTNIEDMEIFVKYYLKLS